ncbi:DinB family protein [Pontibacter sp. SGAir0037]|uniref:DinB family protein n=1 Tax=Pontibacter sp. SGAir0037 TaxID=2571030 RepID=UPI0010CCE285|nr:DinB family protein [Pontibacter sp. SGAir0037]QCR21095.1 DinB family protein [Pontibacter sp. SGAir0037]
MAQTNNLEVWLRGPLPDIPQLLQPIAHALLQAGEELAVIMQAFPDKLLWEKPAGVASVGFHLQHLTGVLDRLFTYARGEALTAEQLAWLEAEGKSGADSLTGAALVKKFRDQTDRALEQLRSTPENSLKEARGVGRSQIPSTVHGLLVHAAEHTMRHVGQLYVTACVVKNFSAYSG